MTKITSQEKCSGVHSTAEGLFECPECGPLFEEKQKAKPVSTAEIIKFVEYVNEFYGKGVGIYAEDFEGGGVTITQIHQATMQYIESGEPFQGDSMDREAVRTILQENYNPLK